MPRLGSALGNWSLSLQFRPPATGKTIAKSTTSTGLMFAD